MVCCVISRILLFDMGMHECLEKILTKAKWKWKHEWNISSLKRSSTFTLQFGLVWSWRMCWKFFPCSCLKFSWSGLFSFGDVNNAPKRLTKFPSGLITIWRIWNECITLVMDYLMGRRIKHYWLMMNLPKCLESKVVWFFSWIIQRTNVIKEQGAMVGPRITLVAIVA
jgi:hypothetical protein